ncbi:unnamed protein product [Lactuca saligna]|uniref:Uncharacterized protein n=1 Tax=Lactuca saligna TaxID=75948 RepID=A0AA35ZG53_LACSI|nr:unnamed protein product [Lactuca saligna]
METRALPFNDTVRLALSKKLKPTFALLNKIIGVLGSSSPSKQIGEEEVNKKEDIDHKGNESCGSRKKGKAISEEEYEENMTGVEKAERKLWDKELDELNAL